MAKVFNSPSKYVQGPDALSDLGGFVARLGSKALVLITASGKRRVGDKIEAGFAPVDAACIFEEFGGECSKNEVARLRDVVAEKSCDVIVGVGGGKTLDTRQGGGLLRVTAGGHLPHHRQLGCSLLRPLGPLYRRRRFR